MLVEERTGGILVGSSEDPACVVRAPRVAGLQHRRARTTVGRDLVEAVAIVVRGEDCNGPGERGDVHGHVESEGHALAEEKKSVSGDGRADQGANWQCRRCRLSGRCPEVCRQSRGDHPCRRSRGECTARPGCWIAIYHTDVGRSHDDEQQVSLQALLPPCSNQVLGCHWLV